MTSAPADVAVVIPARNGLPDVLDAVESALKQVPPPAEVIVYCNGGISATVPLTALSLLGVSGVSLYDGSWNEWGNDDARPVETGPARR